MAEDIVTQLRAKSAADWNTVTEDAALEIERLRKALGEAREKFVMHTAEVGAWLSALADVFGIKAETVKDCCSQIYDSAQALKENADFLRASVGECHNMISRKTDQIDSQPPGKRGNWAIGDLPMRFQSIVRDAARYHQIKDALK